MPNFWRVSAQSDSCQGLFGSPLAQDSGERLKGLISKTSMAESTAPHVHLFWRRIKDLMEAQKNAPEEITKVSLLKS